MGKFEQSQLGDMVAVGMTTSTSVRLWMRTQRPGKHRIEIYPGNPNQSNIVVETTVGADNSNDHTHSVLYPDDFPNAAPLVSNNRYRYRIVRTQDTTPLGEGFFGTAPASDAETPDKYSIAVMSCHQPFNSDGSISDRSMRMLRLVPKVLDGYKAKCVIVCGDQIYADAPENFSLINPHYAQKIIPAKSSIFEWTSDEVRRAYQERYRIFWSMNEVRHMYANYPCYPILDDHEIIDDWGSSIAHADKKFANLCQGAKEAYFDYQASRVRQRTDVLPDSFHYEFDYGSLGGFVMDIRSQRKAGKTNQLYSDKQFKDLEKFLDKNGQKRVLLIVTSVPVVHLPSWLTDVGAALVGDKIDFPDHWAYSKNLFARDRLLTRLHRHQEAHPKQRVVLVSGDVHIGCAFAIHWQNGKKPKLYQLTSSAVSNRMKKSDTYFSKVGPDMVSKLKCNDGKPSARVNLLKAAEGSDDNNPFGGLNIGIIEVTDRGDHSTVNLKLIGYPASDNTVHETMFGSGEL
jgi:alkaline phosphatase D